MQEHNNNNSNNNNTRDKLSAGPVTTESLGTSSSSNLTIDTDGAYDDPNELFPHNNINLKEKK